MQYAQTKAYEMKT